MVRTENAKEKILSRDDVVKSQKEQAAKFSVQRSRDKQFDRIDDFFVPLRTAWH